MHAPLLSGGKLAVNGCNIVFDRPNAHVVIGDTKAAIRSIINQAEVHNKEDILLTVPFNEQTLTWQIDSNHENKLTAMNVHRIKSQRVLAEYYHQAAGHPVKSTWLKAIREGEYSTWPGLTYELVSKYLPEVSENTAAGHMHRRRQGVQSTSKNNSADDLKAELDGTATIKQDRTQPVGAHIIASS